MLKQIILLLLVSIAIVLFMPYAHQGTELLIQGHDWIEQALTDVFTGSQAGNIMRSLLALLCIPVIVAFVPSFLFWLLRKYWFPYFMMMVWVIWLIQVGALTITYKGSMTTPISTIFGG